MKTLIIILLSVCICDAQSDVVYDVTWEQKTYDTLTDFTSIIDSFDIESFGQGACFDFYPIFPISLGFNFPFYETGFSEMIIVPDGWATPTVFNIAAFPIRLDFANVENEECSGDGFSADFRVERTSIDDMKVTKFELSNARLDVEVQRDTIVEHYLNFQYWFYEDGAIELRFGDIDLSQSSYYDPDVGVYDENFEVVGPYLGINTVDGTEAFYISGPWDDPIISESMDTPYLGIPPAGWTIRWERSVLNSSKEIYEEDKFFTLYNNILNFDNRSSVFKYMSLYDISGQLIMSQSILPNQSIDLNYLISGMYILNVESEKGILQNQKIIIQH
jgi:hypothetical protein